MGTPGSKVGVLQQQADNNYQDADMEKIQYDQTEAGLVYQPSSSW